MSALFRVYLTETDRPAYLPAGEGLAEAEAQRLSDGLIAPSYLVQVSGLDDEEADR